MTARLRAFARNRNGWLATVFLFYVALVFAFGASYHWIYKSNRTAFAFNSDILRSQSRTVEQSALRHVDELTSDLGLLRELRKELGRTNPEPTIKLDSDVHYDLCTMRGSSAEYTVRSPILSRDPPPPHSLVVKSLDGRDKAEIYADWSLSLYPRPKNIVGFRKFVDTWITHSEADQNATRTVLRSLTTGAPDVWSYWDFVYFSAITQFTVGYGDILPNSTSVRMVVVLQTCIAAALLIVVINIGFARRRGKIVGNSRLAPSVSRER